MYGEVFSGSSDTTFLNTLITVCFNRYVCERVLCLSINDYDLTAKGDDSVVVLNNSVDKADIRRAYAQVYYTAALIKHPFTCYIARHGCGMVLKFLSISDDLDDIDYCSTNCYYCDKCQSYKLTRKIDRFFHLTPWADSILNLPRKVQLAYMQNLYLSNLRWMEGLPLFSQFNDLLRTDIYCAYALVGKVKNTRNLSQIDHNWYHRMFDTQKDIKINSYQRQFGKNHAFSIINQNSQPRECCAISYKSWLFDKLGLNNQALTQIINDINLNHGDVLYSPTLSLSLIEYDKHRERLLLS
jgi:hypothetical protein